MAYTLTFADTAECQIDDHRIYSPYTLNNGDSIQVYSTAGDTLTINGTEYKLSKSSAEAQPIDISDTDINITVNTFPPALTGEYLTINFSATETAETPKALSFRGKILKSPSGKILCSGHSASATKLATPQNITVDGTAASWDEVENATSYELFADGTSIGEYAVPTGYKVTLTSWDEEVGGAASVAVKFNTPPTSRNDYDYRTDVEYNKTGLYGTSGSELSQPITVNGVSKAYVFVHDGALLGEYKLNGVTNRNVGVWNEPAIISLTQDSTLSLLHAQD